MSSLTCLFLIIFKVSKKWSELSEDSSIWKRLCDESHYRYFTDRLPQGWKRLYIWYQQTQRLLSDEEIKPSNEFTGKGTATLRGSMKRQLTLDGRKYQGEWVKGTRCGCGILVWSQGGRDLFSYSSSHQKRKI